MKKRWLAILLTAALAATMVPVAAWGDELPADEPAGEEILEEEAAPDEEAGEAVDVAEAVDAGGLSEEEAPADVYDWAGEFPAVEDFPPIDEGSEVLDEADEAAPVNGAGSLSGATITPSKKAYRYEIVNIGSAGDDYEPLIEGTPISKFQPKVSVKIDNKTLKEGTDYTVSLPDDFPPFSIPVLVTGIGDYAGSSKEIMVPTAMAINFAGGNRYKTNIEILKGVTTISGSKNFERIVVVTGEEFPDALAANAYAGLNNNPLILVKRKEVPAAVSAFLGGYKKTIKEIVVIGGKMEGAIKDLKKILPSAEVKTIAGSNRYQTADKVTRQFLFEKYGVPLDDNSTQVDCPVFVTTGQTPADALSASGWSYSLGIPVLLVQNGTFNKKADTANVIKHFKTVCLLGDAKVTKDNVVPAGASKIRIGGKNRWETSRKIADYFKTALNIGAGAPIPTVYVPSDDALFPDALAAGQMSLFRIGPTQCLPSAVILVNEKHSDSYSFMLDNPNYGKIPQYAAYMYNIFIGSAAKDKGKIYDAVMKKIENAVAESWS